MTDLTPAGWFVLVPACWLTVVVIAGLWLRSRERSRERPIDEHQDAHWHPHRTEYRRHNDVSGGSFQ